MESLLAAQWGSSEDLIRPGRLPVCVLYLLPSLFVALNSIQARGAVEGAPGLALLTSIRTIAATQSWFVSAVEVARSFSATASATEVSVSSAAPGVAAVDIDIAANGLVSSLKTLFSDAIKAALPVTVELGLADAIVTRCTNEKFGDYQCNNAMALSKSLKGREGYTGQ